MHKPAQCYQGYHTTFQERVVHGNKPLSLLKGMFLTIRERIYLCTYSVEQSPSEASRLSASQEIPFILWKLKVHYKICMCLPPFLLPDLSY